MMKFIILLTLLILTASHSAAHAEEQYTRVGVALGCTGALSLIVERHIGDMSVRMNVGCFELNKYSFTVSANRYVDYKDGRFHYGIGAFNFLTFHEGIGILHFLHVPVGWEFGNDQERRLLGFEVDLNWGAAEKNPGLPYRLKKSGLLLAGLNYEYRL